MGASRRMTHVVKPSFGGALIPGFRIRDVASKAKGYREGDWGRVPEGQDEFYGVPELLKARPRDRWLHIFKHEDGRTAVIGQAKTPGGDYSAIVKLVRTAGKPGRKSAGRK